MLCKLLRSCSTTIWPWKFNSRAHALNHWAQCSVPYCWQWLPLRDERPFTLHVLYTFRYLNSAMALNDFWVERKATISHIFIHERVFHKALNTHDCRRAPAWNRILFRRISQSHQASALKQLTTNVSAGRRLEQGGQRKDARLVLEQRWFRLIARPEPYVQSV